MAGDLTHVEAVVEQIGDGRHLVPDHLWTGISNHILYGSDTGDFLTTFFSNDLCDAIFRADEVSLSRFHDLALFLHNYAPANCHGSPAAVEHWRRHGGIKGGAHRIDPEGEA